ncbi:nacht and ankyrin domain protein [Ophiostoma piceae UAMH 11346]|uniref:Nacht and ankyrin domain protein n=1 Tax=Ophiostoma piceae (strain UAMH 11346) TaxID=1262450 RepID=S3C141_OPHP1|nr:nacht and ankyrin domain protein [Ophiostoma piceae UAMH 11346]
MHLSTRPSYLFQYQSWKSILWYSTSRLKWPLKSKEVMKTVESLHKHRDNISASLTIDHTAILMDNFERIEDNERMEILDWISKIKYGTHHNAVRDKRTTGTCEWLIQRETFRQWENGDSSVLMVLKGSPGAGKTYLTSHVIDHTQSRLRSATNKIEGFAYFYCNRNDDERRQPLSVFRSYTRQLAAVAGQPELVQKRLRSLWLESQIIADDLGMEPCKKHILSFIDLYDRTTIVLDALDECELRSRIELVEAIKQLLSQAKKPLRVFLSSRPAGDLFVNVPIIEIQATDNQNDIQKFVHGEIVKHPRWQYMSTELRENIETTILTQSQGMFQWAYLQISQILELQTQEAIRNRLGKLPKGLDEAYDDIYNEIALGDVSEKAIADRAFMWVACAIEPLREDQLLDAVRFDPEDVTHKTEKVSKAVLLNLCRNLLIFDGRRKVWRFSHLSVTEYFENHHWTLVEAHCNAAKVCLGLLVKPSVHSSAMEINVLTDREVFPIRILGGVDVEYEVTTFRYYYHRYLTQHIRRQEGQRPDARLSGLLVEFLGSPLRSSEFYIKWHDYAYLCLAIHGW